MCLTEFCAPELAHEGFQVAGTVLKNPPASAGDIRDAGLIPGLGRYPGEGDGNPFQYKRTLTSKHFYFIFTNKRKIIVVTIWSHLVSMKEDITAYSGWKQTTR